MSWIYQKNGNAKDILDDANIDTPSGKGYVTTPSGATNFLFKPLYINGWKVPASGTMFVNPYSWHDQFKKKYGATVLYAHYGVKSESIYLDKEWQLKEGDNAPDGIQNLSYHSDLY